MRAPRQLLIAGATAAALAVDAHTLHGFDRPTDLNHTTVIRFAGDVRLPGARLPAGTYVFMLADPVHARALVTIASRDRRDLVVMTFTRIVNRPSSVRQGDAILFGEDLDGAARVATWWPSGETTGREFVYRR